MKTNEPLAAVIDCDGVCYNYVDTLAPIAATHFNRPQADFPPAAVWNFFSEQWKITSDERNALLDYAMAHHGFLSVGVPYDGSLEGIQLLLDNHAVVDIATDMPNEKSCAARLIWLRAQGLDLDSDTLRVSFTADKGSVALRYRELGYRVVALDDKIENYLDLESAGAESYLLDQAWNRELQTPSRVSSVLEFATIVLGLNAPPYERITNV